MLSETLTTALEGYAIGPKVRRLRLRRKLGLVQLGEHTGLSPALLSKIERGQLFPTLPTLQRIAMVFGVGLEHFFKEDNDRPVHAVARKADRIRLPDKPSKKQPAYYFESLDYPANESKLNGYYVEVEAQDQPSDSHEHPGAEIVFVVRGQLVVNLDGEDVTLSEGDSMYFDSGFPHSYRKNGPSPCAAVVVVTPDGVEAVRQR
jgi:quercetin dioxygenase-like cupin family protein/DNA-binding XRE family transcriptional regulator